MRVLVTGVGGFIGSALAESLLADGHHVLGIDALTPSYDPLTKQTNLGAFAGHPRFQLVEGDLNSVDLPSVVEDMEAVFHLAGLPGVREAWTQLAAFIEANVLTTQRLLASCVHSKRLRRFVLASSSSVYGNSVPLQGSEGLLPSPQTAYAISKVAAENVCIAYAQVFDVPTVVLRYFTVYGPRQRPDMAIFRAIEAARSGSRFRVHGDGSARRSYTFVDDIVAATKLSASQEITPGTVIDICGGAALRISDVLHLVEDVCGLPIATDRFEPFPGEAYMTVGDGRRAQQLLGWSPQTRFRDGVAAQVTWQLAARNERGLNARRDVSERRG